MWGRHPGGLSTPSLPPSPGNLCRGRVLFCKAADVDGEKTHQEESREEDEDGDGHGSVEICGGVEGSSLGVVVVWQTRELLLVRER